MPIMRTSGDREVEVGLALKAADESDKKNCVRLHDTFECNHHLCLVYDWFEMDLRRTLNKFGKGIGLSLDGVCSYAR